MQIQETIKERLRIYVSPRNYLLLHVELQELAYQFYLAEIRWADYLNVNEGKLKVVLHWSWATCWLADRQKL